jgi:hypothetical protein
LALRSLLERAKTIEQVFGVSHVGKSETKKSKSEHLQRTPQGKSGCTVLEISFFAVHAGVFCCFGARLINAAFMLDCAGKIMTAKYFFFQTCSQYSLSHKYFKDISIYKIKLCSSSFHLCFKNCDVKIKGVQTVFFF